MKAKIYQPSKNAMQSGLKSSQCWLLEFTAETPRFIDPLMGWNGSRETTQQIRLKFATAQEAEQYALSKGISYTLSKPKQRHTLPKAYADNFSFKRIRAYSNNS